MLVFPFADAEGSGGRLLCRGGLLVGARLEFAAGRPVFPTAVSFARVRRFWYPGRRMVMSVIHPIAGLRRFWGALAGHCVC